VTGKLRGEGCTSCCCIWKSIEKVSEEFRKEPAILQIILTRNKESPHI
jgi:hypothetical protein